MRHYTKLTYWENRARVSELEAFDVLVAQYASRLDWYLDQRIEDKGAKELRKKINHKLHRIHEILNATDVFPITVCYPPTSTGPQDRRIDVVENIFRLHQFDIEYQDVHDILHVAVGKYVHDHTHSTIRTFNPLFWVGLGVDLIASLPVAILGKLGFDRAKIEESAFGRILRGATWIITLAAALLTILAFLGVLDFPVG